MKRQDRESVMHRLRALALLLLLTAAIALMTACGEENNLVDTLETEPLGDIKDFTASTVLDGHFGKEEIASKDLTMMYFWSTDSDACLNELLAVDRLWQIAPDNVQIVLYCMDPPESRDNILITMEEYSYTGTALLEPRGDLEKLVEKVDTLPTVLFFNSKGEAVGPALIGGVDDPSEDYPDAIDDILEDMGKSSNWKE